MKKFSLKAALIMILCMMMSCQETVVINIVHTDGSVTRRIIIKVPDSHDFKPESYRVPFDSTWKIKDTIEIEGENDTTWIRTAEKLFKNVEEINQEYKNDKGSNKGTVREARFNKKFHWFNTIYTFSEYIDKTLSYGYPLEQYLTKKELEYLFLPDNILTDLRNGPDSLIVKQIEDSIEIKSEKWMIMSCISEWEGWFQKTAEKSGKWDSSLEFIKTKDTLIYSLIDKAFNDSAANNNVPSATENIMITIFGDEIYKALKPEIDSSYAYIEERFSTAMDFNSYEVKTLMPGKLVATNGSIDQNGEILWPVKMELFFTQPYEMRAESKTANVWAWVVSGVFLVFVMIGLAIRFLKRQRH